MRTEVIVWVERRAYKKSGTDIANVHSTICLHASYGEFSPIYCNSLGKFLAIFFRSADYLSQRTVILPNERIVRTYVDEIQCIHTHCRISL